MFSEQTLGNTQNMNMNKKMSDRTLVIKASVGHFRDKKLMTLSYLIRHRKNVIKKSLCGHELLKTAKRGRILFPRDEPNRLSSHQVVSSKNIYV